MKTKHVTNLDELKDFCMIQIVWYNKANIPGIPEEMDVRLEEAEEHIYIGMQSLQEVPLNMNISRQLFSKSGKMY